MKLIPLRAITATLCLGTILFASCNSEIDEKISQEELKSHISYLASDSLEGRKTGSKGARLATTYISEKFQKAGLQVRMQNFELITDIQLGEGNSFVLEDGNEVDQSLFTPFPFSSNGSLDAKIAFAGYGFNLENDSLKWNDYETIDVKNKWVLVFRGNPDYSNDNSPFIEHEGERNKVLTAKDQGAAGVIFINPVAMSKEDKLVSLYYDKTASGSGIPVMNIKRELCDKILKGGDYTIEELEQYINKQFAPVSFEIDKTVKAKVQLIQKTEVAQNVIGVIEGSDKELKSEMVIVGAHFDHLGFGGPGSGSRIPDTTAVHNGADDNASGVATLIEMAEAIARNSTQPKRSITFVAFDAEEMGLLGAKQFVKDSSFNADQISAMLNFDMIGRLKPDSKTLSVGGTGTSLEADSLLQLHLDTAAFNLAYSPNGYGPSDHAAFYTENIPVFFFSTGAHSDYHTPQDDIDSLNFVALQQISDFGVHLIQSIANHPNKLSFKKSGAKQQQGQRMKLKVTLGIIPDFSGVVKEGLGIDGVRKGGPADLAGMKKGDAIIAMDGLSVGNIYDYMARLKKLESGSTITVEIMRNKKKVVLLVQL